jgi:hypothetical protein
MLVVLLAPSIALACTGDEQDCHGTCIPRTYQCILEPWPGMPQYFDPSAASGPLSPFLTYVNSGVWQFAFRVGVAVAILNGVYGGFLMVKSNGESGQIDEGKQRFLWSGIGLVILLLSGAILAFINPVGFGVL